jgi:hypothetical protein
MKRMESPSAVGVAVAMPFAVPEVTTTTTTEMRVAGAMTHRAQIPSLYRYLHQQTITKKKTRGYQEPRGFAACLLGGA